MKHFRENLVKMNDVCFDGENMIVFSEWCSCTCLEYIGIRVLSLFVQKIFFFKLRFRFTHKRIDTVVLRGVRWNVNYRCVRRLQADFLPPVDGQSCVVFSLYIKTVLFLPVTRPSCGTRAVLYGTSSTRQVGYQCDIHPLKIRRMRVGSGYLLFPIPVPRPSVR